MKKGVLGIISLIVAVAALISIGAVIFLSTNSSERKIISFIRNVDSCNTEKVSEMIFTVEDLGEEFTSALTAEDKTELISKLGFSVPDLPSAGEESVKIDALKVVGMSEIEVDAEDNSVLTGLSALTGTKVTEVSCYSVMLEYTAADEEGEDVTVYNTETIYTVKANDKIKIYFE